MGMVASRLRGFLMAVLALYYVAGDWYVSMAQSESCWLISEIMECLSLAA